VLSIRTHGVTHGLSQRFEGPLGGFGDLVRMIDFGWSKKFAELVLRGLLYRKSRIFVLNVPPTECLTSICFPRGRFVFDANTPMVAFGPQMIHPVQRRAIPEQVGNNVVRQ